MVFRTYMMASAGRSVQKEHKIKEDTASPLSVELVIEGHLMVLVFLLVGRIRYLQASFVPARLDIILLMAYVPNALREPISTIKVWSVWEIVEIMRITVLLISSATVIRATM